jgi:hypothetical protein
VSLRVDNAGKDVPTVRIQDVIPIWQLVVCGHSGDLVAFDHDAPFHDSVGRDDSTVSDSTQLHRFPSISGT